jgi:hypothetical protein
MRRVQIVLEEHGYQVREGDGKQFITRNYDLLDGSAE